MQLNFNIGAGRPLEKMAFRMAYIQERIPVPVTESISPGRIIHYERLLRALKNSGTRKSF